MIAVLFKTTRAQALLIVLCFVNQLDFSSACVFVLGDLWSLGLLGFQISVDDKLKRVQT